MISPRAAAALQHRTVKSTVLCSTDADLDPFRVYSQSIVFSNTVATNKRLKKHLIRKGYGPQIHALEWRAGFFWWIVLLFVVTAGLG